MQCLPRMHGEYAPVAKDAVVVGNMECIKEQLRVLRHASLTNIQKLLHEVYTYICHTFFCNYSLNSDYSINSDYLINSDFIYS